MNQITEMIDPVMGETIDERQIAEQLLARAKEQGVSKDTISKITDKVIEEMTERSNRPLDRVYPVVFNDVEIRRIICSTNAIESLNARYRCAVRARGHFPNDAAALKYLHLGTCV